MSKAGLMMIDVNRRISQWDQQRIMSTVEIGGGRTQIIGGHRQSKAMTREASIAEPEAPRASAIPGAAGVEPGKPVGATTGDGTALGVPDQGQ